MHGLIWQRGVNGGSGMSAPDAGVGVPLNTGLGAAVWFTCA